MRMVLTHGVGIVAWIMARRDLISRRLVEKIKGLEVGRGEVVEVVSTSLLTLFPGVIIMNVVRKFAPFQNTTYSGN